MINSNNRSIQNTCYSIVNGEWHVWGKWSTCGSIEDQGKKYRKRSRICNNPAPQNGGKNCTGISTAVQMCGKNIYVFKMVLNISIADNEGKKDVEGRQERIGKCQD